MTQAMRQMVSAMVMMGAIGLVSVMGVWASAGDALYQAAQEAAKAEQYEVALEKFEAALTVDPNHLVYGNAYRQTVVKINDSKTYDRCIAFFKQLVTDHPKAANAWMNYGYAYVDKIPIEGAITQVLLANTALGHFSTAVELEETWLSRYTRGNSYLYWPAIFGRTPQAIADLERAIKMAQETTQRSYHVRAYIALGEAYWRLSNPDKAHSIWREALQLFPDNEALKTRLELDAKGLNDFLTAHFEPSRRVDTNVSIIWEEKD